MLQWLSRKAPVIHQVVQYFNTVPLPANDTPATDCPFLVIDLELTGLNEKRDHIVSIGWVPVRQQQIILSDARYYLIRAPVSVGQSAVFHGVHDKHLVNARDLSDVLIELMQTYAGYIFVAHHSQLEQRFLKIACQRCFGTAPRLRFIDTMQIEWLRLSQQGKVMTREGVRLPGCLKRHKLPLSEQHHALEDAYGCALLLLSQIKQSHPTLTLGDLYHQSR
ncbi:exonuclease domain-containing protein [Chromatiaceae bacterium AAb-1]|nr:exonuclease domain-containing protein [Chromatiaceae bacterium AAb-1]